MYSLYYWSFTFINYLLSYYLSYQISIYLLFNQIKTNFLFNWSQNHDKLVVTQLVSMQELGRTRRTA